MDTYLWKLKEEKLKKTNLFLYSEFVNKKYKLNFNNDFNKIWEWSISNKQAFWKSIWDFTKVRGVLGKVLIEESEIFYKNKFFPDSKLNYAENLLKKNDDDMSIIFKSENGFRTALSWKELNSNVGKISNWMKLIGLKKGERVAAYLPNIPQTVIAYLSTAALGGIWSSCSPDFGTAGVIDRFSQINPKILFIGDKYFYAGKKINILERLPEILKKVKSIQKVVVIPYPGTEIEKINNSVVELNKWEELLVSKDNEIKYSWSKVFTSASFPL